MANTTDTTTAGPGLKRTPLAHLHEARGARWMALYGWEIPACYGSVEAEYRALTESAGLIDLSQRGKLLVTGRDRRTWLHGQVTQDIAGLPDGRGVYAAILTPQGRMVTDLRVYALPDSEALLLDYPAGTAVSIPEHLDRYLVMERAELEDITDAWALLSIQGPLAAHALGCFLGDDSTRMDFWQIAEYPYEDHSLYLTRVSHCGEDGYDLFVPAECAAAVWGSLSQHRREIAVTSVGWEALNLRRVEGGVPWWGFELDPTIVPLEARLEHAIHFRKGCYVGQEIIARIEARGHVNTLLAGFFVHGEPIPRPGTELARDGRTVGRLTSVVHSLALNRPIALGYLRREFQEPGTRLQAPSCGTEVELEVAALPFLPHGYPAEAGAPVGI